MDFVASTVNNPQQSTIRVDESHFGTTNTKTAKIFLNGNINKQAITYWLDINNAINF